MKSLLFLTALLFSANVFSCQNLSGVYFCTDDDGVGYQTIQQWVNNDGFQVFQVHSGTEVDTYVADSKWYSFEDVDLENAEHLTSCNNNFLLFKIRGSISGHNYSATTKVVLSGGQLNSKTTSRIGDRDLPIKKESCSKVGM